MIDTKPGQARFFYGKIMPLECAIGIYRVVFCAEAAFLSSEKL
jgi:hypothetical protein